MAGPGSAGALVNALTNENQLVELADGTIMMDARQSSGDHRWVMISSDGGRTWSQPRPGQSVTPVCTSIERYTLKAEGDDRNRILWDRTHRARTQKSGRACQLRRGADVQQ